jgi:hypothetical protein
MRSNSGCIRVHSCSNGRTGKRRPTPVSFSLTMDTKLEALSAEDKQLLRRLVNRGRIWRCMRWMMVGLGICMLAFGTFVWIALWQELKQEHLLVMLIAVVAPACSFLIIVGVIFTGYAFLRWNGDRTTQLLLRLTEDACDKHAGREQTGCLR